MSPYFLACRRSCNGHPIKPDGKNIKLVSQPDGSHVLIIEKVGPEHAGEYAVTATNDQGSVTSSAPLDVQGSPAAASGRHLAHQAPHHTLQAHPARQATPTL